MDDCCAVGGGRLEAAPGKRLFPNLFADQNHLICFRKNTDSGLNTLTEERSLSGSSRNLRFNRLPQANLRSNQVWKALLSRIFGEEEEKILAPPIWTPLKTRSSGRVSMLTVLSFPLVWRERKVQRAKACPSPLLLLLYWHSPTNQNS